MRKNILVIITAIIILVAASPSFATSLYEDLAKEHWAYESVTKLSFENIITGYPDGSFKPNSYVTYGEFIKMAVISTGEGPGIATDGNHWAKNFYNKGLENGWYNENDINEKDLPHPIPRQHMALIVSKIINKDEKAVKDYGNILSSISDVDINNRYEFEIVTAYGKGVLSGYPDGTFIPEGTLTRAESASVIQRLVDEEARTVPDADRLQKDIEKNRPKSKLEVMKENAKANITFAPEEDVLPDGTMSVEKSIQYMDKLVDTIVFSGSNGEYYMAATFPELPEGFKWVFHASVDTTRKASDAGRSGWALSTRDLFNPEWKLNAVGIVKRQIKGVGSLKDLQAVILNIDIKNMVDDRSYSYQLAKGYDGQWLENQFLRIWDLKSKSDIRDTVYDYDIERHFMWR